MPTEAHLMTKFFPTIGDKAAFRILAPELRFYAGELPDFDNFPETNILGFRFVNFEQLERFFILNVRAFENSSMSTKAIGKTLLIFPKAAK